MRGQQPLREHPRAVVAVVTAKTRVGQVEFALAQSRLDRLDNIIVLDDGIALGRDADRGAGIASDDVVEAIDFLATLVEDLEGFGADRLHLPVVHGHEIVAQYRGVKRHFTFLCFGVFSSLDILKVQHSRKRQMVKKSTLAKIFWPAKKSNGGGNPLDGARFTVRLISPSWRNAPPATGKSSHAQ